MKITKPIKSIDELMRLVQSGKVKSVLLNERLVPLAFIQNWSARYLFHVIRTGRIHKVLKNIK